MSSLRNKFQAYYFTAIFSFIFAVVGFAYNTWRLESSEDNSNTRTAAFEMLKNLAELEQNVYAAYYDEDNTIGNPRIGWVKVGLINDLSGLVSTKVETQSLQLRITWQEHWVKVSTQENALKKVIERVEAVREAIKYELKQLQ